MNKVILCGNLGRDPELRYTQSGQAVANVSLATTEKWKSKEGEKQERTDWHRLVAWGPTAQFMSEYLGKGCKVIVEGKLQTRSWEDKDGNRRETTEVTVEKVEALTFRERGDRAETPGDRAVSEQRGQAEKPPIQEDPDIPF
jgi:single-strand DNA-binding protein